MGTKNTKTYQPLSNSPGVLHTQPDQDMDPVSASGQAYQDAAHEYHVNPTDANKRRMYSAQADHEYKQSLRISNMNKLRQDNK